MQRCENCGHLMEQEGDQMICTSCYSVFAGGQWTVPGREEQRREQPKVQEAVLDDIEDKIKPEGGAPQA